MTYFHKAEFDGRASPTLEVRSRSVTRPTPSESNEVEVAVTEESAVTRHVHVDVGVVSAGVESLLPESNELEQTDGEY